jgi:hypothetical protein
MPGKVKMSLSTTPIHNHCAPSDSKNYFYPSALPYVFINDSSDAIRHQETIICHVSHLSMYENVVK